MGGTLRRSTLYIYIYIYISYYYIRFFVCLYVCIFVCSSVYSFVCVLIASVCVCVQRFFHNFKNSNWIFSKSTFILFFIIGSLDRDSQRAFNR